MNRSRIGVVLLSLVAFAAVAAGASGGLAATRALSRAVADTGESVVAMHAETKIAPLPIALTDHPTK